MSIVREGQVLSVQELSKGGCAASVPLENNGKDTLSKTNKFNNFKSQIRCVTETWML